MKKIAIDYDSTITEDIPRPLVAPIRKEAIKYIKLLHGKGYTLYLWTARDADEYFECIEILSKNNLLEYFSNDFKVGYSGKIKADFIIDDRSVVGKLNWRKIYKYIIKNIR